MADFVQTSRTTPTRKPERAAYDRATVHAILDEALHCHVGLVTEHGPAVIPTLHVRLGDTLYVHGSPASGLLRTMQSGVEVCVTVSIVDGLVIARSAFHHSLDYRSVVVFGRATPVTDPTERARVLDAFVEHVVPGRMADLRPHTDKEVRGTLVLALPLDTASAKVRTGGPVDDADDLGADVWAGVVPLALVGGAPETAPDSRVADAPSYLTDYRRG